MGVKNHQLATHRNQRQPGSAWFFSNAFSSLISFFWRKSWVFGWLYSLLFITGFTQMLVKLDRLYVYEVGFKTLLKTGHRWGFTTEWLRSGWVSWLRNPQFQYLLIFPLRLVIFSEEGSFILLPKNQEPGYQFPFIGEKGAGSLNLQHGNFRRLSHSK